MAERQQIEDSIRMSESNVGHVRDMSDRLLEELDELKALERDKRRHEISTPRFHQLADDIADKSREIFATASEERDTGDQIGHRQGVSTEEVAPSARA